MGCNGRKEHLQRRKVILNRIRPNHLTNSWEYSCTIPQNWSREEEQWGAISVCSSSGRRSWSRLEECVWVCESWRWSSKLRSPSLISISVVPTGALPIQRIIHYHNDNSDQTREFLSRFCADLLMSVNEEECPVGSKRSPSTCGRTRSPSRSCCRVTVSWWGGGWWSCTGLY